MHKSGVRMWALIPHPKDKNVVWALWHGKETRQFGCQGCDIIIMSDGQKH